jgi:hypothetical protein
VRPPPPELEADDNGFRTVSSDTDIWFDLRWAPPPQALYELPADQFIALRFWHSSEQPAPLPSSDAGAFDPRGSDDSVTGGSAPPVLTLPLPLLACGVSATDNRTASSFATMLAQLGGTTAVWRRAFEFAGLEPSVTPYALRIAHQEMERVAGQCSRIASKPTLTALNGDASRGRKPSHHHLAAAFRIVGARPH